jgi:hypothetical protein
MSAKKSRFSSLPVHSAAGCPRGDGETDEAAIAEALGESASEGDKAGSSLSLGLPVDGVPAAL